MQMNIARYIDHTLLKSDATPRQITKLCEEAVQYGFASVCINPSYVSLAKQVLAGTSVKICTVIGFPRGDTTMLEKANEMDQALIDGGDEFDMVINIERLKSGDIAYVQEEISMLAWEAHLEGKILKVIIETCLLKDDEKRLACVLAKAGRADYVKTSTGFSTGGAIVADVLLMRSIVGPDIGVKASGGIADYVTAKAMIDAGATRIGTSKGIAILSCAPKCGGCGQGSCP
jgi:deoxyribose-phosphate aldolase